ncbi:PBP/GOBP family [Popillia japonica]|uniref:PBP/GOBP family n=1 Tax=Popillia japonica TaxID=7064 RepID=A0AAW1KNL7_POPJA
MKSLVTVLALLGLYSPVILADTVKEHGQKVMEQIIDYATTCADSLGVSPEDMKLLMEKKLPASREGQCMPSCVNKKFGIQKADGTLDKEYRYADMEKLKAIDEDVYNKMNTVWEKCVANGVDGSDECDTGIKVVTCMKEECEKLGLSKEAMGF